MTLQRRLFMRTVGAWGCTAAIVLATTGCNVEKNPYQPTGPTDANKAAAQLETLPSLEDTQNQMMALIERVGEQITAVAPAVTFSWRLEPSRAGCAPPFEQSDGQEILLAKYVSDTPIPERNWKQAYDIAAQAAGSVGATQPTVFKDEPDNHDVQFSSDTGTVLRLGSQKAALLTGSTGCRLPAK